MPKRHFQDMAKNRLQIHKIRLFAQNIDIKIYTLIVSFNKKICYNKITENRFAVLQRLAALKATPHNYCRVIASANFSADCRKRRSNTDVFQGVFGKI